MGITNSRKKISTDRINCGGTFDVTLALCAEPNIMSNPTDIVLVLDRSGSMSGSPLDNLKKGAIKFIDIIDEATDGTVDGQIGLGSRIGIVSFADAATQNTQLITSIDDLKDAVNGLEADGLTNHRDAFTKALALFDMQSTNEKVIVMFTDGETTVGGDATPIAEAARAQGIIIYCIGLIGNDGIDEEALNSWASEPASAYVAITPNEEDLEILFENIAQNITKPGATNIVLNEILNPCFKIKSITNTTKGQANITGQNSLRWTIDSLGVNASEGAMLVFNVEHIGKCSNTVNVNQDLTYDDNEQNEVDFDNPELFVYCVKREDYPTPIGWDDYKYESCIPVHVSVGWTLNRDGTRNTDCNQQERSSCRSTNGDRRRRNRTQMRNKGRNPTKPPK